VARRGSAALLTAALLLVTACGNGSDPAAALTWCVQHPEPVAAEVLDPGTGVAVAAEDEWNDADSDLTFGSFADLEQAMANGDATDQAVALDAMRTRVPQAYARACALAYENR
jgi:hypothetical protein